MSDTYIANALLPDEMLLDDEDIESPPAPTDADLSKIADGARAIVKLENDIKKIENLLEKKKQELKVYTESVVPDAMTAAGTTGFDLARGWRVEIQDLIVASIPKDNEEIGFQFLEDHKAGSLIKNQILFKFGKGEAVLAKQLLDYVKEHLKGLPPEVKRTVHYQTLGKYVREIRDSGMLDDEARKALGVFESKKAVVKRPAASQPDTTDDL